MEYEQRKTHDTLRDPHLTRTTFIVRLHFLGFLPSSFHLLLMFFHDVLELLTIKVISEIVVGIE